MRLALVGTLSSAVARVAIGRRFGFAITPDGSRPPVTPHPGNTNWRSATQCENPRAGSVLDAPLLWHTPGIRKRAVNGASLLTVQLSKRFCLTIMVSQSKITKRPAVKAAENAAQAAEMLLRTAVQAEEAQGESPGHQRFCKGPRQRPMVARLSSGWLSPSEGR